LNGVLLPIARSGSERVRDVAWRDRCYSRCEKYDHEIVSKRRFPTHRADGSFCVSARFETSDDEAGSIDAEVEKWIAGMESEFPGALIDDMGRHPRTSRLGGATAIAFDCDADSTLWKGWMVDLVVQLTTRRMDAQMQPLPFVGFFDEVAGVFHGASVRRPEPGYAQPGPAATPNDRS
jgi:hypothetical protein